MPEVPFGMSGEHCGEVYRTGAFCAVEAPHGFGPMRVHIHGLGAITPAGGHGDGGTDTFTLEFLGAGSGFGHTSDGAVGNHTLHGGAVGVTEVG